MLNKSAYLNKSTCMYHSLDSQPFAAPQMTNLYWYITLIRGKQFPIEAHLISKLQRIDK